MGTERTVTLKLPWPVSVNAYWGHSRFGVYVTSKGKAYKENVFASVMEAGAPRMPKGARLSVTIEAYGPNQTKYDIDNLQKALFDSLTAAFVWEDDSLVDELHVFRRGVLPPGTAVVTIRAI